MEMRKDEERNERNTKGEKNRSEAQWSCHLSDRKVVLSCEIPEYWNCQGMRASGRNIRAQDKFFPLRCLPDMKPIASQEARPLLLSV